MARLSIEQKWWTDLRRDRLIEKVGSAFLADGLAVNLWRLSQDNNAEPFENRGQFSELHLEALCSCGLAVAKQGLIFVKGAAEHHAWIVKQREKAKKGGKARAKNFKALAKAPAKPGLSPGVPSLLLKEEEDLAALDLLDPEDKNKGTLASLGSMALPAQVKNPVGFFIGRYVKAFQRRYGEKARPELHDKKIQGQIKLFVQSHPNERACQLIETYLQMDDPWFKTKTHDFITFKENLQKVGLALDTGKDNTGSSPLSIAEILRRRELEKQEVENEAG